MPEPENPPDLPTLPQTTEVSVDANIVIELLRQQISELHWQNTMLRAQLITAKTGGKGSDG